MHPQCSTGCTESNSRPGEGLAHYGRVPFELMDFVDDGRLRKGDLWVLWAMQQGGGQSRVCYMAQGTIAKVARTSRKAVQRSLARLEATGWIVRRPTSGRISIEWALVWMDHYLPADDAACASPRRTRDQDPACASKRPVACASPRRTIRDLLDGEESSSLRDSSSRGAEPGDDDDFASLSGEEGSPETVPHPETAQPSREQPHLQALRIPSEDPPGGCSTPPPSRDAPRIAENATRTAREPGVGNPDLPGSSVAPEAVEAIELAGSVLGKSIKGVQDIIRNDAPRIGRRIEGRWDLIIPAIYMARKILDQGGAIKNPTSYLVKIANEFAANGVSDEAIRAKAGKAISSEDPKSSALASIIRKFDTAYEAAIRAEESGEGPERLGQIVYAAINEHGNIGSFLVDTRLRLDPAEDDRIRGRLGKLKEIDKKIPRPKFDLSVFKRARPQPGPVLAAAMA